MLFKRNDLHIKIIQELSTFLEALPAQVGVWDKKVITHLASHPDVLKQFESGTDYCKWDIYSDIRYH